MAEIFDQICELMQLGKAKQVKALCEQALEDGISAADILEKGLLSGMSIVGQKFKNNEIFVPEVLIAARAMSKSIEVLKPHLGDGEGQGKGTVILGTVKGDLHDIGKNLVRILMEGKGLTVIDLGVDVDADAFVQAVKENNADVIACSALLTTTMPEMETVVNACKEAGIRDSVKIMVGGAPVSQEFCDRIGADLFTADAYSAAAAALSFCTK